MSRKTAVAEGSVTAVVGAPLAMKIVAAKVDASGVPTQLVLFPYPSYTNDDGTYVTDDLSQKLCVRRFAMRGNPIVIDYEHATLTGQPAPAAGRITKLTAGGKAGLIADVVWTRRAAQWLRDDEYYQHSPVYWIDTNNRVVGVHSLALTNSPKSWNQPDLKSQIAAKAVAEYTRGVAKEEGTMKELISSLRYALGLSWTSTFKELRAALAKVIAALPNTDDLLAKAKIDGVEGEPATVLAALGLTEAGEDGDAKAAAAPAPAVASAEVLELFDLPADATLAQVQAKVIDLSAPADMVPKADHDRVLSELAAAKQQLADAQAKTTEEKVEALITANAAKLSPAKAEWIRKVAAKQGVEHAAEVVANLPEILPRPQVTEAEQAAAPEPELAAAKATSKAGPDVNQEAALIRAKCEQIMREKGVGYEEANEIRKKEAAR